MMRAATTEARRGHDLRRRHARPDHPPSTVLIFVGDILQGANQQAQLELGNLAPEPISVGQLFAAR